MAFRLLITAALILPLLALAGCRDYEQPRSLTLDVYEDGRAEVLGRADSGRALVIEHEPFDSVMTQPMVMELPLADPREGTDIEPGDKIAFDLVLDEHYRLRNVEKLPSSTALNLSTAGS